MRAVNLVPPEARQGGLTPGKSGGAVYGVLGGLAALLLIMSVSAVSKKDRAEAEAQLAQVQQSTQQYAQVAGQYARYKEAASGATQRIQTIQDLSGARFDWAGTLRDLSRVLPATARVDSLDASVKAGGGGGGSAVRAQLPVPAIAMEGCTRDQSTAADLVTSLQAMRRVTNVTLESSQSAGDSGAAGTGTTCTGYSFKLTVFYAPGDAKSSEDIAAAGAEGGATPASTTAPAAGGGQ